MKIKEIISWFNEIAPFDYQESYDNSGLQIGNPDTEITSSLICLDVTEAVVEEAVELNTELIISHHPVIFGELKSLTGKTMSERVIMKSLLNNIAILSVHTNFDSVFSGVNSRISHKLKLKNLKILKAAKDSLVKLVFFVPPDHAEKVRKSIFDAGAGVIGEYDMCSFNMEGTGTFRGSANTNPFLGKKEEYHSEKEIRVETILPCVLQEKVVSAMLASHPYEEVAYDLYPLKNKFGKVGMGMIGDLPEPVEEIRFLQHLKKVFHSDCIRHTKLLNRKISKVAVCGGSGSFLLKDAILQGADIFVSGDFRYHQFFDAESKILIADIGHFESEQFTKELLYELLIKKFPKFAVRLSKVNTNPINYI
jgi:dinuclear metal center YbgI/SA1388 family protein